MFSSKSLAMAAAATFSLIAPSAAEVIEGSITPATYVPGGNSNLVTYWGAGDNEKELSAFCYETTLDIIPIAFMNTFPAQGNGLPGFVSGANGCWGLPYPNYNGRGYNGFNNPLNNDLPTRCPYIQQDIPLCQKLGKKVLLSLGGDVLTGPYQLTGANDGLAFAEFLWGAYGPYNQTWININPETNIRPFDRGLYNTDLSSEYRIDIDGFDFDIERAPIDGAVGYIAMVNRLRALMARDNPSKEYIISASPQCVLPEMQVGQLISGAKFDLLWIQFYNNPQCSAQQFFNPSLGGHFNFDEWVAFVNSGKSVGAKLYAGLPAASDLADYLQPAELSILVNTLQTTYPSQFGGLMLWEATSALSNNVSHQPNVPATLGSNVTYYEAAKYYLNGNKLPSTTTSSTSTSSKATTTSSSSVKTTTTSSTTTTLTSSSLPPTYHISTTTTTSSKTTSSSSSKSTATIPSSSSLPPTYPASIPTTTNSKTTTTSSSDVSTTNSKSTITSGSKTTSSTSSETTATTSSSSSLPPRYSVSIPTTSSRTTTTSSSNTTITSSSKKTSSTSSEPTATTSSSNSLPPTYSVSIPTTTSSRIISSSITTSSSVTTSRITTSSTTSRTISVNGTITSGTTSSITSRITSSITSGITPSITSGIISRNDTITSGASTSSTKTSSTSTDSGIISASTPAASFTTSTTSTFYETTAYTITSCAPTVSDCPGKIGSVTTETIAVYTTVCPVTATQTSSHPVQTSVPAGYTISTVHTTTVYTITSCAPTVTDCPAKLGSVTTDVISLYTTICPVTAAQPYPTGRPGEESSYAKTHSTTTPSSTSTTYFTVQVPKNTKTMVVQPVYPITTRTAMVQPVYPTQPGQEAVGTSQASSISARPSVTYGGQGETTQPSVPLPVTGGGIRMAGSKGLAVVAFLCGMVFFG